MLWLLKGDCQRGQAERYQIHGQNLARIQRGRQADSGSNGHKTQFAQDSA
jgi:hypothetical protein